MTAAPDPLYELSRGFGQELPPVRVHRDATADSLATGQPDHHQAR
jgi:hypothetical protein